MVCEVDETYGVSVQSMAVDLVTGEVGLFGYYGGFATYNESEGFVLHRQANIEEFDGLFAYSGTVKDGGGYYSLVYADGNVSVRRFNFQSNEWIEKNGLDIINGRSTGICNPKFHYNRR